MQFPLIWDVPRIRRNAQAPAAGPARLHALQKADNALRQRRLSVIDDHALFAGASPNDYRSFGPYWWPNPDTPDGLPWVRRDGDVNPATVGGCRSFLEQLAAAAQALALGWIITGEARYTDHAAVLLRAWFIDPHTRMNPHLQFGQAIPGKCDGRGIGIIDTTQILNMLDAIAITADAGSLSGDELADIRDWVDAFGRWCETSSHGVDERAQHNNHGTWYDAQVAGFALFAGRDNDARDALIRMRDERIAKHIQPDGSQPHELRRTRSFDYSMMNLKGMLIGAQFAKHVNVDIASRDALSGRQLRDAVGFFRPYLGGLESWQWEQMTDTHPCQLAGLLAFAGDVLNEPEYHAWAQRSFDHGDACVHRLLHG